MYMHNGLVCVHIYRMKSETSVSRTTLPPPTYMHANYEKKNQVGIKQALVYMEHILTNIHACAIVAVDSQLILYIRVR